MKQFDGKYSSVEKALRVLQVFQEPRPFWGVRELSAHLNFSPATVLRILQTLKNYGFVDQDPNTRLYRLGTIYYCFLHALQSTHPISRTALPYLQQLTERTHETAHLNTIDGVERLCIENVESLQPLKAAMPIGMAAAVRHCMPVHHQNACWHFQPPTLLIRFSMEQHCGQLQKIR